MSGSGSGSKNAEEKSTPALAIESTWSPENGWTIIRRVYDPADPIIHPRRRMIGVIADRPNYEPTQVCGSEQNIVVEFLDRHDPNLPYKFHNKHHVIALRELWQDKWNEFYGITGRLTLIDNIKDWNAVMYRLEEAWQDNIVNEISLTIPRILHFMWLSPNDDSIPERYRPNVAQWTQYHPDWEIRTWNMTQVEELMQKHYPTYYQQFKSLPKVISKCDIARMAVLAVHGGVYTDLDFWCMRNIDPLLYGKNIMVAREAPEHEVVAKSLFNGILGAIPDHPFIRGWVVEMFSNLAVTTDIGLNLYVMNTTGPFSFYRYYEKTVDKPVLTETQWLIPFTNRNKLSTICDVNVDYYSYTLWYEGTGWGRSSVLIGILLVLFLGAILIYGAYRIYRVGNPRRPRIASSTRR